MTAVTREALVHRARFVPKSPLGVLSLIGWAATIIGVVLVVNGDIGRWNAAGVTAIGVALMVGAGIAIQRNLEADAKAAGFDQADIRAIEDEAERLNEEED